MQDIQPFPSGTLEALAKLLGICGTGTFISAVLKNLGLEDRSNETTKWRRLYSIFSELQREHHSADLVLDFIRSFLTPTRFIGHNEEFKDHRQQLNEILAFHGLEYGKDGQFGSIEPVRTLEEAEARAQTITAKFQGRRIHPEVLKYCSLELLQDNYFHAVFEATKGLAQRIRDLAEVDDDGSALVARVFSGKSPILAFNKLRTNTEKSEHRGYTELLKGCFSVARNPAAHQPRSQWQGEEDDAADHLALISLLHQKLDGCNRLRAGGA